MTSTYTETILFSLPLPSFLLQFKNSVNSFLIPRLDVIISDIEKQQANSSVLTLLCLLVLLLILKSLVNNLFKPTGSPKAATNKPVTQSQVDQQIRALANEIRNVKNSLKKIIQQASKQPQLQNTGQSRNEINSEDVSKLIQYYRQSADDFNNLAEIVLNSQQSIFKQLKNAKKLKASVDRNSSHGTRESKQQLPAEHPEQPKQIVEFKPTKQEENGVVQTQLEQQTIEPDIKVPLPPAPRQIKPPAQSTIKRKVPPPPVPR